jgi:hypothetical protein
MKIIFSSFILLGVCLTEVWAAAPSFLKDFPSTAYHQLLVDSQVVGKTEFSWAVDQGSLRFKEKSEMRLTLFQKSQSIATELNILTGQDLALQNFQFQMTTDGARIKVSGERLQAALRLRVEQMGSVQTKDIEIREPLLLTSLIRPFLLKQGLPSKETSWTAHLLEPSALTTIPLTLRATPAKAGRWNVSVEYLSQRHSSVINAQGALIQEESDLAGLKIVASPVSADKFKSLQLTSASQDLVELAKVNFPVVPNSKDLKSFAVQVDGIDLSTFELNRHRQRLDGNLLRVDVEKGPRPQLPVQSIALRKDLEKYLQGDASIPVHDANIQKRAREIIGDENTLWGRAMKVHRFVYDNVKKVPTVSVPNALEVLKTMVGDCNEHAVLFTALARAAGVPTRIVVGLVYGERFYSAPGFYYHAWNEVFDGQNWVAIDPTWDQVPADPTHIAFVEGGLDQQVYVTALMGRIQLKPVSQTVKP